MTANRRAVPRKQTLISDGKRWRWQPDEVDDEILDWAAQLIVAGKLTYWRAMATLAESFGFTTFKLDPQLIRYRLRKKVAECKAGRVDLHVRKRRRAK